jgi:ElaB/YqjD/DUF883 family membrane-anchored ribosome-binding protein
MNEAIKDKLVKDLKEVIHDTELLIRETAGDMSDKAKEIRSRLTVKLEDAKVRLKDLDHVVRDVAVSGARETDKVIRDHPYESIGVSFGVGLLIGILLNRK